MNCERARERMMEWMDGRLDPATATELKAHVDQCPGCQQELAAMRQMVNLLDAPVAVKPSSQLRRGVLAAIEAEKRGAVESTSPGVSTRKAAGRRFSGRNLFFQLFGACALLIVGFVAGVHRAESGQGERVGDNARHLATQEDIAALKAQMDSVGTMVNYTLQRQQSASTNQRLEGVLATASLRKPDRSAIDSLIGTLALDPSANVRLNAVQALYSDADQDVVRTAIEISLPREQSPIVQLAMIDFLTAAKDRGARPILEKLTNDEATDANVREAAKRAIYQL